jgi:hypothetical protein
VGCQDLVDAFNHDRYRGSDEREAPAQRGYRFGFAVPLWVILIWRLDCNLQTKKDREAAENGQRQTPSRPPPERKNDPQTQQKSSADWNKIHQNSPKRGSHAFYSNFGVDREFARGAFVYYRPARPGCSRDCVEICRDIRSYLKVSEPGSPGFRTLEALRYRAGLAFRFNAKLT